MESVNRFFTSITTVGRMTSHVRMLRYVIIATLFCLVCTNAFSPEREKRQVTYEVDDGSAADEVSDIHLERPVTTKPLPAQIMYPGDLTNFFTTESSEGKSNPKNNDTKNPSKELQSSNNIRSINNIRSKRSLFSKKEKENADPLVLKSRKPQYKFKHPVMSESRLSASYHKPSSSVMNDIPAEMYFDGAGFLRYEDDSEESSSSSMKHYGKTNSRSHQDNNNNNNKALKEFRDVFNISREREPTDVKFDDDVRYPDSSMYSRISQERTIDHGTEGTENGKPLGMEFLNTYQGDMFINMHNNYAQMAQTPSEYQQDPFSFTYPNFYNAQQNFNQMSSPVIQEPLLQNHRLQSSSGLSGATSPAVYASSTSHTHQTNPGYASNLSYQQYAKIQRRRRSVMGSKSSDESMELISDPNQDHYTYSRVADQQDSSSGFIPITGSFNGGTIQLNFPLFGGNPSYSPRPPMQTYHTYSVPLQPERPYRSSMERFYHPSEARRYSYGILGSGNFEVIRGGVFPGDRQPGGFVGGGFTGERIPYNNGFGNYGTTEIILDGPIQGFQGFDNFPAHLINALSKHSELAIHPDRREAKDVAS